MSDMAEKFSQFMATESARQERDKHQIEVNDKLLDFIDAFNKDCKPVIDFSKKIHGWLGFFVGKIILPGVAIAILAAAGFSLK
jgi:hypothetical protein